MGTCMHRRRVLDASEQEFKSDDGAEMTTHGFLRVGAGVAADAVRWFLRSLHCGVNREGMHSEFTLRQITT